MRSARAASCSTRPRPGCGAAVGQKWDERRYVALAQVFDDADDAALKDEDAVALLTVAQRDQIIGQALIRAGDPERARYLRSVWDQAVTLRWRSGADATPLEPETIPDPAADDLSVAVEFQPDGATLAIPFNADGLDLVKASVPEGLSLDSFPPILLLGHWTVSDARPAPWQAENAATAETIARFKGKSIDVGYRQVVTDTPIVCNEVGLATYLAPPKGLFQGGLAGPSAAEQARAAGLPGEETRSLTLSCETGLYDFHFPNRTTALIAYDNVIFTLTATP
jgi:hypothetical protein